MDIGKLVTALGFAAGGYFAYESGLLSTLTGGLIPNPNVAAGTTPATTTPAGTPPVNPVSPPPAPPPTEALVLAAMHTANQDPPQTFDTFNYYYQQKRGVAGPDPGPLLPANLRNELLSADEWWSYMTKAGFNGLGRVGMLARRGASLGGYVQAPALGRWIY